MKPVKNKTKSRFFIVNKERHRMVNCYRCGQVMHDDTTYMHNGCWRRSSQKLQNQAEWDLTFALRNNLKIAPHGMGGISY